jgi:hypothetical protein
MILGVLTVMKYGRRLQQPIPLCQSPNTGSVAAVAKGVNDFA